MRRKPSKKVKKTVNHRPGTTRNYDRYFEIKVELATQHRRK